MAWGEAAAHNSAGIDFAVAVAGTGGLLDELPLLVEVPLFQRLDCRLGHA